VAIVFLVRSFYPRCVLRGKQGDTWQRALAMNYLGELIDLGALGFRELLADDARDLSIVVIRIQISTFPARA
jgi:hypothetical protein